MGETKKVQLAVRVPADVRDLCLELARKVGMSKNVFVEKLIRAAAATPLPTTQGSPLAEGQLIVDDQGERYRVGDVIRSGDEIVTVHHAGDPRPFAANCKAGTLHWKHGPGNPCRFCDGEI